MGSLNMVQLIGNLGKEAEYTSTQSGFTIARLSLATTTRRKDSQTGDWKDKTEWHRVVLLGKTAETLRDYLVKGKQIYVQGRIESRSWEDKDGNKRYTTEIIADRIQLLGGSGNRDKRDERQSARSSRKEESQPSRHEEPPQESQEYDDEEVPF